MSISKWWAALPLLVLGSASADAESGLASFYPGVGKKSEMTCAHRSHPFGKKLRVSHGKISIECLVNDRGPFIRGRIIDVSTSAARALGMIDAGVVPVLVEVVDEAKRAVTDANDNARQEIPVPLDVL
jgi:peptidoglycan lytic transglycosylase